LGPANGQVRLLVITNLFFPDRGGGASVFSDLCFGLQERGWDVTVFTTHPYYPEWRRKSDQSPWRIQEELIRGIKVFRHGLHVPANPSKLWPRLLYELSFGASLTRSLFRGGKFDIVMVYCPMAGAVLFAAVRTWLLREPLWLNVQDIPADAAAASGISQSGLFNRTAAWAQEFLFNRADVWSTISPIMSERLLSMRQRKQPLHVCPNWLNESLAACLEKIPSKVGRLPAPPVRLLYAGNIGKKQGLLEFCRNLAGTSLNFQFRIHGNGGEADAIKTWGAAQSDARFSFGEFLDEPGFLNALHDCDVFVISEKPDSGASFIPSKLIPAIATGTPIFAKCDRSGPLGREIEEANLGMMIERDDELEPALAKISEDNAQFVQFQKNCLQRAQTYRRDFAISRFQTLLNDFQSQKN
jgi:colanic acid biosynthesis glycosyl transferase WcaI